MSYSLEYLSPDGRRFRLIGAPYEVAFVPDEGIEGFIGEFEDSGVTMPGVHGRMVDYRDRTVSETTGTLHVRVIDPERWPDFIGAFHSRREGTLVLEGERRFVLPVRLAPGFAPPEHKIKLGSEIALPLVSDRAVWQETGTGTGAVTVTNWGDVTVYPRISWSGAGGAVILPSGARFTLPSVPERHTVSLSPLDGGEVTNSRGVDKALSKSVGAVAEGVPIDTSRTFTVPTGARLEWEVGVFNPWR